jgi:hypothetical protein
MIGQVLRSQFRLFSSAGTNQQRRTGVLMFDEEAQPEVARLKIVLPANAVPFSEVARAVSCRDLPNKHNRQTRQSRQEQWAIGTPSSSPAKTSVTGGISGKSASQITISSGGSVRTWPHRRGSLTFCRSPLSAAALNLEVNRRLSIGVDLRLSRSHQTSVSMRG